MSIASSTHSFQSGDACWLVGLRRSPELNHRRVILIEWVEKLQRWRCAPHGWIHKKLYIAVKAQNLNVLEDAKDAKDAKDVKHFCLRCAEPRDLGVRCCGWYAGLPPVTPGREMNGMDLKFYSWPHGGDAEAPYVHK